ncbi:MAG: cbb3-type cytochrome c oxidase subunit 3 [Xanthomonadaceae bacterium]|nr:cbb3-type cytochrome c oxidase subunit 3 [Xanthomonadaceae bacterium]MDE2278818.1 cbb3-type cytochrome c oxidase subunit 3 [Xanthomonadaceae bacterium]
MSPLWGQLAGVMIVLMMLSFIGIWVWAWRKYHKPVFDRMAQLPMQEDDLSAAGATLEETP